MKYLITKSRWGVKTVFFLLLMLSTMHSVSAQTNLRSAETSFKFIANILQTFRNTGRLVNNPGIDGADLEHFIALLDDYYLRFSRGFNSESAMCGFYRDPENGRMTIEERAEISFSFLRDLDDRVSRYISIDGEFSDEVETQFGSILLRNITAAKVDSISNQRLPSSNFEEAAKINFLDTMCD